MPNPQPIASNYDEVKYRLASRLPFRHSTMDATFVSAVPWQGRLNQNDFKRLEADIAFAELANQSVYVVLSYSTPIAWIDPYTDIPYLVEQKFSATTSRHQTYVRGYLR